MPPPVPEREPGSPTPPIEDPDPRRTPGVPHPDEAPEGDPPPAEDPESGLRMIQGGKRPRRGSKPKSHGSMMERFEERWRRRREQGFGRDY